MTKPDKISLNSNTKIILPAGPFHAVMDHCRRKISEQYLEGESRERKAFGLVGGTRDGDDYTVRNCFPLLKNMRGHHPYNQFMDSIMEQHAIPSETPLARRGWVADPEEFQDRVRLFQEEGLLLLGAYHMHRVAWPDDPLRDRPTTLDAILAANSRMLIFIISMVEIDRPVMRCFYEGDPDREVKLIIE